MAPYVTTLDSEEVSHLPEMVEEMGRTLLSVTQQPSGLVVKDAPFSFRKVAEEYLAVKITLQKAIEAGKRLSEEEAISLVFLLADDVAQALQICTQIEQRTQPYVNDRFTVGQKVLTLFVHTSEKQNLQRGHICIICALHLLRKYRMIKFLTDMSVDTTKQQFDGREHLFLQAFRVNLYLLALHLNQKNSQSLLNNIVRDFGSSEAYTFRTMETNLLQMMVEQKLHPGEPISKVAKCLPGECKELRKYLPIAECKADTKVLKKGYCFILNQRKFTKDPNNPRSKHYTDRDGTDLDEKELVEVWNRFGSCKVEIAHDLTSAKMKETFKNLSKCDFKEFDFFVLVLMSHGERTKETDYIVGSDGIGVKLRAEICNLFNDGTQCPSLAGKLKLYLVQACRGSEGQECLTVVRDGPTAGISRSATIPQFQDFIIFNSTVEDYASFRHRTEGTYFIQTFCREMKENGSHTNVLELLNKVMEDVKGITGNQQPVYETTFGKHVFFEDTASPSKL